LLISLFSHCPEETGSFAPPHSTYETGARAIRRSTQDKEHHGPLLG
jgi:hypothetical protein